MGFFSDIISDAHRPPMAAFQTSGEPGAAKAEERSFGDPGSVVTEAMPQQRGGDDATASSRRDAGHEIRNFNDAVQPAVLPTAAPGREEQDVVAPDHGVVAEPGSLVSVAPRVMEGKQIEPAQAAFLHRAMAGAVAATGQSLPVARAVAVTDTARMAGDGSVEQEQRQVAMPRQPEGVDLQLVAPQRADAGVETAAGVSIGVAETPPVAPQEPAMTGSVESWPVTPAPAATDASHVRRSDLHQGAALNAGPQVHIGQIDIVVLAPEPARPFQPPVSASTDLANRHYLRRL